MAYDEKPDLCRECKHYYNGQCELHEEEVYSNDRACNDGEI